MTSGMGMMGRLRLMLVGAWGASGLGGSIVVDVEDVCEYVSMSMFMSI